MPPMPDATPPRPASRLTGPQKAAALILGLDEAVAAEVLRHLEPDDLRRLVPVVDALQIADSSELDAVFEEFTRLVARPALPRSGAAYLRRLADVALGEGHLDRLLAPAEVTPTPRDALRAARSSMLAELLSDEHPQVAAVILTQLPRDQAAKVLMALPPEQQVDLIGRLGELEELPTAALDAAAEVMARAIEQTGVARAEQSEFDGTAFAAGLLNELGPTDADRLLAALEDERRELVPKIREAMFTFEDLIRVDKRSIGVLMREVPGDQLRLALRQASEALRELFLSAVSSRIADEIRDDLANMPPVRLSEIEKAQRVVVEAATSLAAEGRITLPSGGSGQEALV